MKILRIKKKIKKKVEKDTADRVRKFKEDNKLKGVRLESDTKRYYPYSTLACHVIGFVGTDNYGLDGIEVYYPYPRFRSIVKFHSNKDVKKI